MYRGQGLLDSFSAASSMQKRGNNKEQKPSKKAGLLPEKNQEKIAKSGGTNGGAEDFIKTISY